MWKDRRPTQKMDKTVSEVAIERRDRSIRDLIDELVVGTQELKALYGKESTEHDPD